MPSLAELAVGECRGRIRTLIIGAGVAGLTLAALLRQRGEAPFLIERAAAGGAGGYNIALFPLGSRVLHGLGLFDRLLAVSTPGRYYVLGNGHGEILHRFDFDSIIGHYGPIVGLRRSELLEVLRAGSPGITVHPGAAVSRIENHGAADAVTFSDGSTAAFDLVVGADGMHSETRKLILNENEFAYWDTGWGCWVSWAPQDIIEPQTMSEYWGAGRLAGIYPVRGAQGVVLAGPRHLLHAEGRAGFVARAGEHFGTFQGPIPAVLKAVRNNNEAFFWDLHDCRCERWSSGRTVLLGDAAAGFLPTAGVGASMAMLAAGALADELSRVDAAHVEYGLRLFERRARKVVEAAQDNSRRLARLMMIESLPLAWGRDQLMKFYTMDRALKEIIATMEGSL